MSKFFTPTNRGRVSKMQELVTHLTKSAQSNKASEEDIISLFGPLIDDLKRLAPSIFEDNGSSGSIGEDDAEPDPVFNDDGVLTEVRSSPVDPRGPSLLSLAREASMEDLHDVVTHYHVRMDDLAFEMRAAFPDRWNADIQPVIDGEEGFVKREERYKQKRGEIPGPDPVDEIAEADQADFDAAFDEAFHKEEEEDPFG